MAASTRSDASVLLDGTEITHVTQPFLSLVGAGSREALLGRSLMDLLEEPDRATLAEHLARVEAGRADALGLAVTLVPFEGAPREAVALSSSVPWEGGECVQATFLDLAGDGDGPSPVRDRAMDAAPIGITIADTSQPDNPLVYANDGFCAITGYPREEVLGRNCRFLQGERTRAEPVAAMRAAIDAGEPVTVDLRNYRKDGTMFWNRVAITPMATPDGTVTRFVGYQRDVSAEKLYERERTLFEKQADVADHAMFITDSEGVIVYVNDAFERITGYIATEAIGETPRLMNSGEQDEAFYEELWGTITAGEVWKGKLVNQTKGGKRYEVALTVLPIEDDAGEITHFAAIEEEVTEDVIRDQTLSVLNRVLRHNLSSAITVIEGQAELLEDGLADGERAAALETIKRQTDAMRRIAERTGKIRTLWQQDGNGVSWDAAHLESLVTEYRREYPEAEIGLSVSIDADVALPNAELFALALDEAVQNAVRYAERPDPTVEVAACRDADPNHVLITVADDGPGIPEHELAPIEAGVETALTHGTGLGLWVMEWVLGSIGGDFEVAETGPDGTVIRFQLPVESAGETPPS